MGDDRSDAQLLFITWWEIHGSLLFHGSDSARREQICATG